MLQILGKFWINLGTPSNKILVTSDVQSLYTNMQPNKGLEALRKNVR